MNSFPQQDNHFWNRFNEPTPEELSLVEPHEFLPRISKWTNIGAGVLLITFMAAAGLTSVFSYNVTVKVPATIRPEGELGIVQSAVNGTVEKIDVQENQVVKQGEPIAYIDDSRLQNQKSQLENHLEQSQLQLRQIDAQMAEIATQMAAQRTLVNRTVIAAQAELSASQRNYEDQQKTTIADLTEAEATWNLAKLQRDRLQQNNLLTATVQEAEVALNLAKKQRDRLQSVVASGAISRTLLEEKQQEVKSAQAKLEQAKANAKDLMSEKEQALKIAQIKLEKARTSINPHDAAITIASERIKQEQASGKSTLSALNRERETLLQQRLELEKQTIRTSKELQQVEIDLNETVIRAPITGTVLQLNLRHPGQVVQPSQAIAQIAPINSPILIKAFVQPQDIDKVKPGQKVQMQVSACPYPNYGTLHGTVRNVAPDALPTGNNSIETSVQGATQTVAYEATIEANTTYVGRENHQCHLQPGMKGRADIISRQETVLNFILRKARLITDF
ncbi:HlyD family secretion protein [Nodularia sphaerocarpa]|uniref:HlyD family secretion protein n=1 Tax=Nodularia sphaerocarpa TaxID=137816 RepID=UPI001EFAF36A|nr:HlyD family efflux transporter periplasmic adaptor subunit [Nodularia sphaerocarpa]MDB9373101.1 HlyD family efflux transporter periplasmic adaptor subunit [Nodularia sphaerocarpa CS-585]MDB9376873.1 HlyD family efflux transporter periplasmic adaptor subunit [Nodularia sphaerocarpa CS-585A2]ULP73231.1 Leukotoxin export protein LtxD [Nodularia sphaerocarpa UHCC 0038]